MESDPVVFARVAPRIILSGKAGGLSDFILKHEKHGFEIGLQLLGIH